MNKYERGEWVKLPYSRIPVGKCRRNNLSRKYIVSGGHQWILNLVGKYGGEHGINVASIISPPNT